MTTLDSPELRTQLSSVWSCSCNAPIREVLISQQGVVAVATNSEITLYAGAPNFGDTHSLSSSPSQLTACSFSSDGTHLLTGDSSGFLKWWDVLKGDCTGMTQFPLNKLDEADELTNSPPPIGEIKCSQESELVAVSGRSTLCIYGDGGLLLHCIGPLLSRIQSMEWKTGEELAVNIGSAVCMISITPEDYTLGHQYPAELSQGSLSTLSCSPDGGMLAGGCSQGEVRIWDLASDQNGEISLFVKQFPNSSSGSSVQCMTWDSTGRFLAAASDHDVIVWDMKDTTNEDDKDNSIVCYGHGQRARIQAMKFQSSGGLLATGGDDGQLLVFDSKSFSHNEVVGGLVGCIGSGHVGQPQSRGSAITALAWHPLGLILAGTSTGRVDAFEVSSSSCNLIKDRTPQKAQNNRMNQQQSGFLFPKGLPSKRASTQHPAGWGGEPLITKRNEDFSSEKFIRRPKVNGIVNNSQIRMTSGKPKVYQGKFKQNPRPYVERPPPPPGGNPGAPNWATSTPMMIPPTMMHWPNYPQQLPPFMGPNPGPLSPYRGPPNHPPHTPESISSEGTNRNGQSAIPGQNRNDRNYNRMAPMNHHQNEGGSMTGPNPPHHAFSMGYLPYPTPHPLGYPPMPYGCYPVHPGPHPMPMTGLNPPTGDQHGIQVMNKAFQSMNVAPGGPASIQQGQTGTQETPGGGKRSPELDEELGSKSSEATNNGVNNGVTPGTEGSPPIDPEGRPVQGQTLYIGNLASGVEETLLMHYFSHYGPIVNVQVIRERDTHISRGFAFVSFAHPFYAQNAMRHMDSIQLPGPFEGRRLKVSFSNRR